MSDHTITTETSIEETILKGLTPKQQEAVRTIDRNLEIIACAGAGKTKTITHRIINLIAKGVSPENIVAITFTRKAAAEMKGRIYAAGEKILGNTTGFAGMFIGTIDSFCLKLLQDMEPEFAKFSVLDDVQTKIFLKRYTMDGTNGDVIGFSGTPLDNARNLYTKPGRKLDYYIQMMSILNSAYHDDTYTQNWDEDIKERVEKYRRCLIEHKYFDFSLLIREMIQRLDPDSKMNRGRMSEFGKKVFEKVKYLTVDEYQDSNPPQEYLVTLFEKYGKANICVVGDADQTIYEFRGSDESNILSFTEKHNAVKISLNLDFRSTQEIIDIANHSIEENHVNDPERVLMERGIPDNNTLEHDKDDTVWNEFADFDEEADFIVDRIKKLHASGIPLSEIAVLFRNRKEYNYGVEMVDFQSVMSDKLTEAGIDSIVEGLNLLHRTKEYKAASAIFKYVLNTYYPADEESTDRQSDIRLEQLWAELSGSEQEAKAAKKDLDSFMKKLSSQEKQYGHQFNMQQVFQDFLAHFSFVDNNKGTSEKIMYNMGKFSKVIADFELFYFNDKPSFKLSQFVKHLMTVAENLYPEGDLDNLMIRGDAVRLMTIHQSKGMEFTAVFIPALCNGILPMYSIVPQSYKVYHVLDALDEMSEDCPGPWIPNHDVYRGSVKTQRKLFYVAVTRAKKYLFLTYSTQYGTKNEEISPFLEEVKRAANLVQYNDKSSYSDKNLPVMKQEPLPLVLNFSLLSNYFDCPYRFKLSNFYGFVQPYNTVQGYGRVLHEIMMHIHRAWIKGEKPGDKELEKIAEEALYLPFANSVERDKALQGAIDCAKAYVKQNIADADKMIASEMDINIEMGDGVSVNGRIDLVRKIDADGKEKTAIVDLKSAGKDAEQCLNAQQLKIYAIGYQEATGQPADYLMIYNLDHPDGSKNAKEQVEDTVLVETRRSITDAAKYIRGNDLPRRIGENCEKCYVKNLCGKHTKGADHA